MSSQEVQHLYEFVDTDEVRDQVFERICRLEDALNEQLYWAKCDHDSSKDRYVGRLRKEKIDVFGLETTIGSILDNVQNRVENIKEQLHVVRSILLSLALPTDCEASAECYVVHAFEVIKDVLEENSLRCKNRIAASEARRKIGEKSTQQAHGSAVSQTPSQTGSSNAQEKQNTAPEDHHSPAPESTLSPFLKFMNKLSAELGTKAAKMKKHEVKLHIEQRWDADALGEQSAHKVEMMATMLRPPEAQKGRAKTQSLSPKPIMGSVV
jgi:hypothetical protein